MVGIAESAGSAELALTLIVSAPANQGTALSQALSRTLMCTVSSGATTTST
jgi:hypothetical protein